MSSSEREVSVEEQMWRDVVAYRDNEERIREAFGHFTIGMYHGQYTVRLLATDRVIGSGSNWEAAINDTLSRLPHPSSSEQAEQVSAEQMKNKRCPKCDAGPIGNCGFYGCETPRNSCPLLFAERRDAYSRLPQPAPSAQPKPDTLRPKCDACNGTGIVERIGFSSAGDMDASNEPHRIHSSCRICNGRGWIYLDTETLTSMLESQPNPDLREIAEKMAAHIQRLRSAADNMLAAIEKNDKGKAGLYAMRYRAVRAEIDAEREVRDAAK